jgi:hypothetical protein
MSAAAQAVADGLAAALDGAVDGLALAEGDAVGLGLGLGGLPQAPTSSAPSRTTIALRERRGRLACAMVGMFTRLQRFRARDDRTRAGG